MPSINIFSAIIFCFYLNLENKVFDTLADLAIVLNITFLINIVCAEDFNE